MSDDDRQPHARPVDELLSSLDVDPRHGLPGREVRSRRRQHGPNKLREVRRRSAWRILLDQVKSMVLILLAVAAALAFLFGQWPEGLAILAVLLVNTLIGFLSEWRARRSMEALRRMSRRETRVRRDGAEESVPFRSLVPGDVVILESGNLVPADMRVIEANALRVNEASLTGEAVAVDKRTDALEAETPLAERSNMLFKGTTVVEGSGEGVVVATGMETELGRIAELVHEAEKEEAPLQERLNRLGHRLAWITIGLTAIIAAVGLLSGQPTLLMIETAIALGVAAIPEGLPIVATIALARGMYLMARRQVLINRLPAVETLGATRIIVTDKTGTLTENRMTLRRLITPSGDWLLQVDEDSVSVDSVNGQGKPAGGEGPEITEGRPLLERALELGVLCNNASLPEQESENAQGDPTEVALLAAGAALGLHRDAMLAQRPERREVAFDPDVMMMATIHEGENGYEVAVKGAPARVLEVCETIASGNGDGQRFGESERRSWMQKADELAADGLRVLAVADKQVRDPDDEPYAELRFIGLLGLLDPPRPEAQDSVEACKRAGIRVVMATGDQAETARAIGRQVGLLEEEEGSVLEGQQLASADTLSEDRRRELIGTHIFARVSPEQKFNLIELLQGEGETVAMTGDGVNDAPALKKADIGVAMGRRGTDAARQAADMVLKDDAFSSIVAAIEQGRVIFGNIRRSVIFMLCTNVAEVLAVAIASAVRAPLPLLPLQILYLNVLTDVFPALALGVGEGDPRVMERPPRDPGESVLSRRHWLQIAAWAVLISGCVLGALSAALVGLQFERFEAITVSFLTLAFAKLWFVFNLREPGTSLLQNDVVRNPWIWISLAFCCVLLFAALYLPGLSDVLETRTLQWRGWALVLIFSLPPFLIGQAIRVAQKLRGTR